MEVLRFAVGPVVLSAIALLPALDRYTAPAREFVPAVTSRIAVLGARSAPKRYWPTSQGLASSPSRVRGYQGRSPWLVAAHTAAGVGYRPGTRVEYRVERRVETARDLGARFTVPQRAILEKLNRADAAHLHRQDFLVVPSVWYEDDLQYSPFALAYAAAAHFPKLLVVDLAGQAFAAYEEGRLVRWGPVSSGRWAHPTPSGWFHLNWRSRGRHSTVNPEWYMEWYFNFDNARGLALHAYVLPGYPASRACLRLLARDAIWIHEWSEEWVLGRKSQVLARGTPLVIVGQYAFDAPPPWRSLEQLARGIDLPHVPPPGRAGRE